MQCKPLEIRLQGLLFLCQAGNFFIPTPWLQGLPVMAVDIPYCFIDVLYLNLLLVVTTICAPEPCHEVRVGPSVLVEDAMHIGPFMLNLPVRSRCPEVDDPHAEAALDVPLCTVFGKIFFIQRHILLHWPLGFADHLWNICPGAIGLWRRRSNLLGT